MKHIYEKITKLFEAEDMSGNDEHEIDVYKASDGIEYKLIYTVISKAKFYPATHDEPGSSDVEQVIDDLYVQRWNHMDELETVGLEMLSPELQKELRQAAETHSEQQEVNWQQNEPDTEEY